MEKNLFDLLVFDEAGQIPMSYALGALQRSKRVLVAGDHQQMSPSSYFKKTNEIVIDVLHQSAFYLKNTLLTHHYRSRHPSLIAFSNHFYYQDKLKTFAEHPIQEKVIDFIYVPDGIYTERVNLREAELVARRIEKILITKEKYGIVAFSEIQLQAIYLKLSPRSQQLLEAAISEDRIFFKALEQVQGEECDHLVISFGYGKNEAGNFEMRFGPLLLNNGSKRLNVLFSRAKKSIEFYASIKSADFGLSKNEGVKRLKDWFLFAEEEHVKNPLNMTNEMPFTKLLEETDFDSFIHLYQLLQQRNWKLN